MSSTIHDAEYQNAKEKGRSAIYSMYEIKLNMSVFFFCSFFRGGEMRKGSEQMARRLKKERHGSWASTWENPTWESCSVAGASPTSFSQSVTPFPLGLWGCTLLPASLCPELL